MRVRTISFLLAACALVAPAATATILIYHPVEDLASMSSEIALGTVRGIESYASEDGQSIYTVVTLEVTESLAGATRPGQLLKVHYFGGEKDGLAVRYIGMPGFRVGEETVLFLKWSEGSRFTIVGLTLGKMEVVRAGDAIRVVRRLDGIPILVPESEEPGIQTGRDESYSLEELRGRVRGAGTRPARERVDAR